MEKYYVCINPFSVGSFKVKKNDVFVSAENGEVFKLAGGQDVDFLAITNPKYFLEIDNVKVDTPPFDEDAYVTYGEDTKTVWKIVKLNRKFTYYNDNRLVIYYTANIEKLAKKGLGYGPNEIKDAKINLLKTCQKYFFINSEGDIHMVYFKYDKVDLFRLATGNMFKTREEAREVLDEACRKFDPNYTPYDTFCFGEKKIKKLIEEKMGI
jgi:hypothetical protein